MQDNCSRSGRSIWKGCVAGALGGLAGSWAMTQFHVAIYGRGISGAREPQSHRPVDGADDPAMKAADVMARLFPGVGLTRGEKQIAAPAVHYAFGAAMGALYGMVGEHMPATQAGSGLPFGVAVWAGADEVALPALGLAEGPTAYPVSTHAEMFAAHLVFGYATHVATQWVRRRLDGRTDAIA